MEKDLLSSSSSSSSTSSSTTRSRAREKPSYDTLAIDIENPISWVFRDVTYSGVVGGFFGDNLVGKKNPTQILKGMTGYVKAAKLTAIMGSTGLC